MRYPAGDFRTNVKAGIMLFAGKGRGGKSGQPIKNRPKGNFGGWMKALERYGPIRQKNYYNRIIRDRARFHVVPPLLNGGHYKQTSFWASMDFSPRDNGILKFANLKLHVYDPYPNPYFYDNDLLDIQFSDLNKDGYKDLVISGIVNRSHEQKDEVISREQVVFIYMFDHKKKMFSLTFKKASFKLQDGPN